MKYPPKFETPEQLQKKIDEYFENCPDTKTFTTKSGEEILVPIPTITGLALFLGFESRQSFYDYEKREMFSYTIKRARLQIEKSYEQMLFGQNCAGAIFALKNLGWSDKQTIENNITYSLFEQETEKKAQEIETKQPSVKKNKK